MNALPGREGGADLSIMNGKTRATHWQPHFDGIYLLEQECRLTWLPKTPETHFPKHPVDGVVLHMGSTLLLLWTVITVTNNISEVEYIHSKPLLQLTRVVVPSMSKPTGIWYNWYKMNRKYIQLCFCVQQWTSGQNIIIVLTWTLYKVLDSSWVFPTVVNMTVV